MCSTKIRDDGLLLPVCGMAALSEICVWSGSPRARGAKLTGGTGDIWWCYVGAHAGMHRNRIHPYFLFPAAYFLFPAVPEQQMGLKMQACAAAAPSGVSVRK